MIRIGKLAGRALVPPTLGLALAAALSLYPTAAPAQALDCAAVQAAGTALAPQIVETRNAATAGQVHEITKLKQLHLLSVQSLFLSGCEVRVLSAVALKRDLKRDFNGLVTFRTDAVSLADDQICFGKVKLERSSLAADLLVGELAYAWAAHATLPDDSCFAR